MARRGLLAAAAIAALAPLLLMVSGGEASGAVQAIGKKTLTVTISANGGGPATGTVTSDPAGISCQSGTCSHTYPTLDLKPQKVTLTAIPLSGYGAPAWLVDGHFNDPFCTFGSPTCTVTMNENHTVEAAFNYLFTVTVTKAGTGHGVVKRQSGAGPLDCGSTCSETFFGPHLTSLRRLSETPDADSTFEGWGGCTDVDADNVCEVSIGPGGTGSVTATFTLKRFDLTVNRDGTGSGTVTSDPAGIGCGADCKETYDAGTRVALQATSAADSTFKGWSGACTGTGACVVTMGAAKSVTATFDLVPQGGGGGSGGGGDGSGGSADQQVDAEVLGVKTGRTLFGKRLIKIELSADETVTVDLTLSRNGKPLASKHVAHFAAGDRIINLVVPAGVKGGTAKLTIELGDEADNTTSVLRSVRIQKRR